MTILHLDYERPEREVSFSGKSFPNEDAIGIQMTNLKRDKNLNIVERLACFSFFGSYFKMNEESI